MAQFLKYAWPFLNFMYEILIFNLITLFYVGMVQ